MPMTDQTGPLTTRPQARTPFRPRSRKLIVGNWKMNGERSALPTIDAIETAARALASVEVGLALPATLLIAARERAQDVLLGAQDIHSADRGAYTGDISAGMVKDAGAAFTLVGHSERRAARGETDDFVRDKAMAALRHGLSVIVCVGEDLEDHHAGRAEAIVTEQMMASLPAEGDRWSLSVAYEPLWAIGSGLTPTETDIARMHEALRAASISKLGEEAHEMRLLYGGSVNASNAGGILQLPNVDGVLVGGASLTAESFVPIIRAV